MEGLTVRIAEGQAGGGSDCRLSPGVQPGEGETPPLMPGPALSQGGCWRSQSLSALSLPHPPGKGVISWENSLGSDAGMQSRPRASTSHSSPVTPPRRPLLHPNLTRALLPFSGSTDFDGPEKQLTAMASKHWFPLSRTEGGWAIPLAAGVRRQEKALETGS